MRRPEHAGRFCGISAAPGKQKLELDTIHRSKADFLLQGALARARGDEIMHVLLYFSAVQDLVQEPIDWEGAHPATLVEVQRRPAESVWMVITALRQLGLRIVGD